MGLKPRAAPGAGDGAYPFPFVGAGAAGYFEWATLYVCFTDPPTAKQRAAIKKLIPEPIADSISWADDRILLCSSGQFINLGIATSYESTDGEPEPSDFFGMMPTTSQLDAFEEHVVRALGDIHAIAPIAFALRPEDFEAGGIELDAWGRWSGERLPEVVLPMLRGYLKDKPRTTIGSYLLDDARTAVPKSARERVDTDFILWGKD